MTPPLQLSAQAHRTDDSPIGPLIQLALSNPDLISLAAGLVDEVSLPAVEIAEATQAVLADPRTARAALQYGTTQGLPSLRRQLAERLAEADGLRPSQMGISADDVILTTGSQQLLYLVCEVLLDPGDIVITEAPSYFVYHSALASHGVRVFAVPMDEGGLDLAALEELLIRLETQGELQRVKLIYTVDYFQNPTGLSLAAARRPKLLDLAKKFSRKQRILILEDAAYRELRYDGPDIPSIKSLDSDNEFVIWGATFSKPCAPGLKTGYGIMPSELIEPMQCFKSNHDFGSSNLAQHIIDRLLSSGAYDRHVISLRESYRRKRDALLAALEESFGDIAGTSWTKPTGGLYVWLTLPEGVDTGREGELMQLATAEGVIYVPGEFCHAGEGELSFARHARLSFGVAEPPQLREGIRRLRRAVDVWARRSVVV